MCWRLWVMHMTVIPLQCGPSSQPSVQSGTPLHSLLMWMQSSVPPHWYSLGGHRDMVLCGPAGQRRKKNSVQKSKFVQFVLFLKPFHVIILCVNSFPSLYPVKSSTCSVPEVNVYGARKYSKQFRSFSSILFNIKFPNWALCCFIIQRCLTSVWSSLQKSGVSAWGLQVLKKHFRSLFLSMWQDWLKSNRFFRPKRVYLVALLIVIRCILDVK